MDPIRELVDYFIEDGRLVADSDSEKLTREAEKTWRDVGWDEGAQSLEQEIFEEHVIALAKERGDPPDDVDEAYIEDALGDFIAMGREQLSQSAEFANSSITNFPEFSRRYGIDKLPPGAQEDFRVWFFGGLFDAFDEGYVEGAEYQINVKEVLRAVSEAGRE